MTIGIVGVGVVGAACKFGFESVGHSVVTHDIRFNTTIDDVTDSEVIFICVPTPKAVDGSSDGSIVIEVVSQLREREYSGTVAIKSTVMPGTTEKLALDSGLKLCFVPEFLRERCAIADFTENHEVCIIGCEDGDTYEKIIRCHGSLAKKFVKVTPTEAEFCKYFNNVYNATLIILANSFYEACKLKKVDYSKVKNAIINRNHILGNYLDCNESLRGFGGMCLPKDVSAMAKMMEDTPVMFFRRLLEENDLYETTKFDGMR